MFGDLFGQRADYSSGYVYSFCLVISVIFDKSSFLGSSIKIVAVILIQMEVVH